VSSLQTFKKNLQILSFLIKLEPGLEVLGVFIVDGGKISDVFQKNFHLNDVLKKNDFSARLIFIDCPWSLV
jgi:hypothetical protein